MRDNFRATSVHETGSEAAAKKKSKNKRLRDSDLCLMLETLSLALFTHRAT